MSRLPVQSVLNNCPNTVWGHGLVHGVDDMHVCIHTSPPSRSRYPSKQPGLSDVGLDLFDSACPLSSQLCVDSQLPDCPCNIIHVCERDEGCKYEVIREPLRSHHGEHARVSVTTRYLVTEMAKGLCRELHLLRVLLSPVAGLDTHGNVDLPPRGPPRGPPLQLELLSCPACLWCFPPASVP